jgi:hypothetical protein
MLKPAYQMIFVTIAVISSLSAQSKVNFLEGNITLNQPTGFFGRNIPKLKIGFEGGYLRQIKEKGPVFWGLSVYYFQLGNATATIQELIDFNLVDLDYSTSSQVLGFNGKFRIYPDLYIGKAEFYAEALLGYKWLYTRTTKTFSDDQDASDSQFEKGSLALTYGAALGCNYSINELLYINIRGNYLPGLSKSYFAPNERNAIDISTLDAFDLRKSTTDIFRWDFGITYKIAFSD